MQDVPYNSPGHLIITTKLLQSRNLNMARYAAYSYVRIMLINIVEHCCLFDAHLRSLQVSRRIRRARERRRLQKDVLLGGQCKLRTLAEAQVNEMRLVRQ
jgi:hypothetical protein